MANSRNREKLPTSVKLSLFISSYFPLFLIIIIRQIEQNINFLAFGGINIHAIKLLLSKFGITIILSFILLFGLIGIYIFIKNMKKLVQNNYYELVAVKIQNKNTESIGYVATYLLPFVFKTYSTLFDVIQVILLLSVMYVIYSHSTLIVVNPLLNLKYSLYEIEYYNIKSPEVIRNGILIIDCHYLENGDIIKARDMKKKVFFGYLKED